jgi:hypothetical protein
MAIRLSATQREERVRESKGSEPEKNGGPWFYVTNVSFLTCSVEAVKGRYCVEEMLTLSVPFPGDNSCSS